MATLAGAEHRLQICLRALLALGGASIGHQHVACLIEPLRVSSRRLPFLVVGRPGFALRMRQASDVCEQWLVA